MENTGKNPIAQRWLLIGYRTFLEHLPDMGHNMRCWQDARTDALTLYVALRVPTPSVSTGRSKVVTL